MSDDRFHFEFFFAVNQVRRWQCEIGAMCAVLTIRGQKACMEDGVNPPLVRQFQLVRQRSQDLYDFKWSLALHRELFVIREESEVLCFQPDLLTLLEWGEASRDAFGHALSCEFMCRHCLEACLLEIV